MPSSPMMNFGMSAAAKRGAKARSKQRMDPMLRQMLRQQQQQVDGAAGSNSSSSSGSGGSGTSAAAATAASAAASSLKATLEAGDVLQTAERLARFELVDDAGGDDDAKPPTAPATVVSACNTASSDDRKENVIDDETFAALVRKDVQALVADSAATRKRALQRLLAWLEPSAAGIGVKPSRTANDDDDDDSRPSSAALGHAWPSLVKPLLKRLTDPVEQCREAACRALLAGVACAERARVDQQLATLAAGTVTPRGGDGGGGGANAACAPSPSPPSALAAPDLLTWLPYVVPVLAFRLSQPRAPTTVDGDADAVGEGPGSASAVGGGAGREPSEEVRLQLVDLLARLCMLCPVEHKQAFTHDGQPGPTQTHCPTLLPFLDDVTLVCTLCMRDPYAHVQARACELVRWLAINMPQPMRAYAQPLCVLAMPLLAHKHARMRVTACQTLQDLMPCGAHECIRTLAAFREHNVIVIKEFFGESDGVRVNYMGLLATDDNARVRRAFFAAVCDWMLHLTERFDYETLLMPYVLSGLGDGDDDCARLALDCVTKLGEEHERDWAERLRDQLVYGPQLEAETRPDLDRRLPSLLPAPFTERPGLGARIVVQKFVPRLLPALCTELADWKNKSRRSSVLLLRTLLVFAETTITSHAHTLMATFVKICGDESIANELNECVALFGRHASPDVTLAALSRMLLCEDVVDAASAAFDASSVSEPAAAQQHDLTREYAYERLPQTLWLITRLLPHVPPATLFASVPATAGPVLAMTEAAKAKAKAVVDATGPAQNGACMAVHLLAALHGYSVEQHGDGGGEAQITVDGDAQDAHGAWAFSPDVRLSNDDAVLGGCVDAAIALARAMHNPLRRGAPGVTTSTASMAASLDALDRAVAGLVTGVWALARERRDAAAAAMDVIRQADDNAATSSALLTHKAVHERYTRLVALVRERALPRLDAAMRSATGDGNGDDGEHRDGGDTVSAPPPITPFAASTSLSLALARRWAEAAVAAVETQSADTDVADVDDGHRSLTPVPYPTPVSLRAALAVLLQQEL